MNLVLRAKFRTLLTLTLLAAGMNQVSVAAGEVTSILMQKTPDGHLKPVPDAKGNIVPDFSYVGYRNGESDIPTVPVVKTISPVAGNNLQNIQNAVNAVSAMPLVNGFRGALLLKPGTYRVSAPIKISASGVVIRGSGSGAGAGDTIVLATAKTQIQGIFLFSGLGDVKLTGTVANLRQKTVFGQYIPVGSRVLTVQGQHAFKVGDRVILKHTHNSAWITLLGMAKYGWSTGSYTFNYKRIIKAVNGSSITIDAPVMEAIDKTYGSADLIAYDWPGKIDNIGIENIRLDTVYASATDEKHVTSGVVFSVAEHGWARNIEAYHMVYAGVSVENTAANISVLDSKALDPISLITGERRYLFNISGQRSLVRGCYTRSGRHDYVTGSRVAGPNVFTSNQAVNQLSDIGPHQRWAVGTLFDNIVANDEIHVQNRQSSGSGHGWAGAQTMMWHCTAGKIIVQSPPSNINWAIGSQATVTSVGNWTTVPGYIELTRQNVWPRSLYEQQMCDRLGKYCS